MISPAAEVQRGLWGDDPRGWAEQAEPHTLPLFEAVLDAVGVGPGTRLLDVGCGTGGALVLAAARGAIPAGIDVTPGLLAIARERLPDADLREGDMEALPFDEDAFDAVVGVNAFQFAGDPGQALREAARVVRPGGLLAASMFAAPERSESTAVHQAMQTLVPPADKAEHAPYALSAPGNLEAALEAAGLVLEGASDVPVAWHYADLESGVRGLMSSAGAASATRTASPARVRDVIAEALRAFEDPATGAVHMDNTFRWVSARRPA